MHHLYIWWHKNAWIMLFAIILLCSHSGLIGFLDKNLGLIIKYRFFFIGCAGRLVIFYHFIEKINIQINDDHCDFVDVVLKLQCDVHMYITFVYIIQVDIIHGCGCWFYTHVSSMLTVIYRYHVCFGVFFGGKG